MKTKITLGTFAILLALIFTNYSEVIANAGGSPGGSSSSGGDSNSSCGQGGCHGGGHTTQAGIIITNIPASGYNAGTTYRINVGGASGTGSKFGFELAAENTSNATVGTLMGTNSRVQIRSNGHATHTSSGNAGSSGNFGWIVNWTAPAAGTGDVKFATAVLVANGNGTNSGDNTIIFNTTVSESATSNISEITNENTQLYPNPIENYLNIYSQISINHLTLVNVEGKIVFDATVSQVDRIDLSYLKKGVYFAILKNNETQLIKKVVKA